MNRCLIAFLAIVPLLFAGGGGAVPLVFDYVGSSGEGGTITGSFGYDTAALDQVPGNNSLGQYNGLGLSGSHQQ